MVDITHSFTYAVPKVFTDGLKERICKHCTHWSKTKDEEKGYCLASDMRAYILGGIIEPVSGEFGCVLWEAKDEE